MLAIHFKFFLGFIMIGVFLKIVVRGLLRFIANSATKEWNGLFRKGRVYEGEDIEFGDLYVKEIIDNLTEERGHELYPFVIDENMYTIFRIPILAETVHLGTYIEGLKSLHRADICGISRKAGQLNINASLGAGPLELTSLVFVKFAHIERLLNIKIYLDYCKVHANFSIDPRTGRNGSLQSLCIDEFRRVGFAIKGFGWWYLPSVFVTVLMKFCQGLVRNIVEFKLEQHVGVILQSHQFPIEGKTLESILVSEDSCEGELEQLSDDSTEIDVESFKEDLSLVSEKNSPKHTKLRKPMWYTNFPLFEDIIQARDVTSDEYEDSDINIQLQFSKDRVVKEDIEPLTRSERPKCYVFFKGPIFPEEAQFCNETSKSLLSDIAKISRYEGLKDVEQSLDSQSEAQFSNCSSDKYSKDSLGLLTSPDVSRGSNIYGSEEKTTSSNFEATDGKLDGLFSRFLVDYPKFVALRSHCEEIAEIRDSNENCEIDSKIKIQTDCNKENSTCNDEKESGQADVDSQNESNEIGKSTPINNAGGFSEETYLELCELKIAYVEKPEDCHNDNLKLSNSSAIHKTSCFNKDFKPNKLSSYNLVSENIYSCLRNEDVLNQSERLIDDTLVKNRVEHSAIKEVKTLKNSNRMEHVESILKWDHEDTDEVDALKSENIRVSPKKSQSLVQDYFERILLEPIEKSDECKDAGKTVTILNMLPGSRENNNEIEPFVKFSIRPTTEQLDDIVDSVFRCFDHACTDPLKSNAFYLPLNESVNFSNIYDASAEMVSEQAALIEASLNLKIRDGVSERRQTEKPNENFSYSLEPFIENDFKHSRTPIAPSEIISIKRSDQINKIKSEHALVGKALMSANAETVPNYDIIDDDEYFLGWVSDESADMSQDASSESDNEEVDMGKPKLCTEFKYSRNCVEVKTKLAETVFGVQNMGRSSPVILETLDTEDSSSALNTETINPVKDSSNNSIVEAIPKEILIDTGDDVDVQTDVYQKIDIDVPVKINEEATASDNCESIDCSLNSYVFINAEGTESETVNANDDERAIYSYEVYENNEMQEADIKSELSDNAIHSTSVSEERAYLPSLIDGSSVSCLKGNQDYSKENEFGPRNSFDVDTAVATSDGVQNIALLPECLNSKIAYNYPDSEIALKDRDNVVSFEDEIIQTKLLQGKVVSGGFNEESSSFDNLDNRSSEDSPKIALEICLDEHILLKDIQIEDAKSKPEQVHPNSKMTNIPLENSKNTVCGEDATESIDSLSSVEIKKEDNLNHCALTEVSLDKDIKLELEDTNNKPEQVHSNRTMTNEPLEKRQSTENFTEYIENASHDTVEMESILSHCMDKITEPLNLDKEQAKDQLEIQRDESSLELSNDSIRVKESIDVKFETEQSSLDQDQC